MTTVSFRGVLVLYIACILFMFAAEPGLETVAQWGRPTLWATLEEESDSLRQLASLNGSLCGARATARGTRQKVISFSLFGRRSHWRGYFKGVEENAQILSDFYPNWTMRVYFSSEGDSTSREDDLVTSRLKEWEAKYQHLDLCDVTRLPLQGPFTGAERTAWRFLPLLDPLVAVAVFRDLDSRPSAREAAAVAEWLDAVPPLPFHVMRDHPFHGYAVLAGMWGARRDVETELVMKIGNRLHKSMLKQGIRPKGEDQKLLRYFLWPEIKGKVMQHDSYFCNSYLYSRHGHMTPWPTRRPSAPRKAFFVGCIDAVEDKPLPPCPRACRPAHHQDWTLC